MIVAEHVRHVAGWTASPSVRSWRASPNSTRATYEGLGSESATALFRALMVATSKDPVIAARIDRRLVSPLRRSLAGVLAAAVDQGRVRRDVDPDVAADLLIGGMVLAVLTRSSSAPARAEAVFDLVLHGMLVR